MMLPTVTSGIVNVFARYFKVFDFTMVLSNTLPSKFTIEPSGWIVLARMLLTLVRCFRKGICTLAFSLPSSVRILIRT